MLYSSTVLARNASSILAHISRLPAELAPHPLLFALSANAPTPSLSPLVSALSALSSAGSVGCLSAPLDQPAAAATATTTTDAPIACSLAFFRKEQAVLFRSDIPGRPETQVGRWHAMRRRDEREEGGHGGEVDGLAGEEDVDWETIWSRRLRGNAVPPALRRLRCVRLCFSLVPSSIYDNRSFSSQKTGRAYGHHAHRQRPPGLQRVTLLIPSCDQGQSSSTPFRASWNNHLFFWKLGLFCSSTPFVTGRPYTLIHNGSVHSTGAVGIALSAGPRPALQTAYPGLRAITPPLKVTA